MANPRHQTPQGQSVSNPVVIRRIKPGHPDDSVSITPFDAEDGTDSEKNVKIPRLLMAWFLSFTKSSAMVSTDILIEIP